MSVAISSKTVISQGRKGSSRTCRGGHHCIRGQATPDGHFRRLQSASLADEILCVNRPVLHIDIDSRSVLLPGVRDIASGL